MRVNVIFGPAEFRDLPGLELGGTACVVFDILRATTSAAMALAHGAASIRPVSTIEEAVALRRADAGLLLAGERGGIRIGPELTGGPAFDFGNSPREFTRERVAGRRLAMTTTNGTRALRACAGAGLTLAASFLNLAGATRRLGGGSASWEQVLLVCSGTGEDTALEDVLAAGAMVEALSANVGVELGDAARIALGAWRAAQSDWPEMLLGAGNARRLRSLPDLAPDVAFCLQRDILEVVPRMKNGELRAG